MLSYVEGKASLRVSRGGFPKPEKMGVSCKASGLPLFLKQSVYKPWSPGLK